jgi:hypothetical protein
MIPVTAARARLSRDRAGIAAKPKTHDMTTIYVALPDELVSVWRPANGTLVGRSAYRLDEDPRYDATFERWEFPPGSTVRCEPREVDGRTILVAVALMSQTAAK